ncbi:MAG: 30S ribosomal protein S6 [Gemmataceae bacterium]|nr:30S ribosomal protein S6 [Gemmataceae bacterium]
MPANVYECMFLLDPTKVAGDVHAAAQQLHGILEKNKSEILASRPWDERRLAYPMRHGNVSHKKGLYYLTYFRTDSQNLANIEHDFSLNESILRSLTLKIDAKLVDTMLTLARDEHALALQVTSDEPGDDAAAGADGEDRPRRPRRHEDADIPDKD